MQLGAGSRHNHSHFWCAAGCVLLLLQGLLVPAMLVTAVGAGLCLTWVMPKTVAAVACAALCWAMWSAADKGMPKATACLRAWACWLTKLAATTILPVVAWPLCWACRAAKQPLQWAWSSATGHLWFPVPLALSIYVGSLRLGWPTWVLSAAAVLVSRAGGGGDTQWVKC